MAPTGAPLTAVTPEQRTAAPIILADRLPEGTGASGARMPLPVVPVRPSLFAPIATTQLRI